MSMKLQTMTVIFDGRIMTFYSKLAFELKKKLLKKLKKLFYVKLNTYVTVKSDSLWK